VRNAARAAIEPVRTRIKTVIEAADETISSEDADSDPLEAAARALEQGEPLLRIVDAALPAGDPARVAMHDDLALTVLSAAGRWATRNKNFAGVTRWVERARKLAEGRAAVDQVNSAVAKFADAETARVEYENALRELREAEAAVARANAAQRASSSPAAPSSTAYSCLRGCGVVAAIFLIIVVIVGIARGCEGSTPPSSSSSSYGSSSYVSSYDSGLDNSDSYSEPAVGFNSLRGTMKKPIAFSNKQAKRGATYDASATSHFREFHDDIDTCSLANPAMDPGHGEVLRQGDGLVRCRGGVLRRAILARPPPFQRQRRSLQQGTAYVGFESLGDCS
jgi:hypothetical protein